MKKPLYLIAAMGLILFPIATEAGARNAPLIQTSLEALGNYRQLFTGVIKMIEPPSHSVVVKNDSETETFMLGSDTAVTITGIPEASLGFLNVGDRVEIVFHDFHGVLIADRVDRIGFETGRPHH